MHTSGPASALRDINPIHSYTFGLSLDCCGSQIGQPQTKIAMKDGAISVYSHLWIKCCFRAITTLIYLSTIAKGNK